MKTLNELEGEFEKLSSERAAIYEQIQAIKSKKRKKAEIYTKPLQDMIDKVMVDHPEGIHESHIEILKALNSLQDIREVLIRYFCKYH